MEIKVHFGSALMIDGFIQVVTIIGLCHNCPHAGTQGV